MRVSGLASGRGAPGAMTFSVPLVAPLYMHSSQAAVDTRQEQDTELQQPERQASVGAQARPGHMDAAGMSNTRRRAIILSVIL